MALPAGWSAQPGQRWAGTGAPGPVDVFRGQSTLVITFEDSSGISSAERADRAAFREFLAGIRLRA
jgi:hypothetical protein